MNRVGRWLRICRNPKGLVRGIRKTTVKLKNTRLEGMNTAVKILVVAIPVIVEIIRISTKR